MSVAVLREVRLYGELGRRYGRVFHLAVATPREAVAALCAVLEGFQRAFVGVDGRQLYHVFVGRQAQRRDVGEDQLEDPLGAREPIRFVPVIAGAKRAGFWQVVAGAALVVAGSLISTASFVSGNAFGFEAGVFMGKLGWALIIGGVIQMLSPQRKTSTTSSDTSSYGFGVPTNNPAQGGPVPLTFGRLIVGSVVVSQGLSTEQLVVSTGAPIANGIDAGGSVPVGEPRYPEDQR